jgi:hypothetical protein
VLFADVLFADVLFADVLFADVLFADVMGARGGCVILIILFPFLYASSISTFVVLPISTTTNSRDDLNGFFSFDRAAGHSKLVILVAMPLMSIFSNSNTSPLL